MRRPAPLLLLLALAAPAAADEALVELDGPATVDGLWLRDLDGDGATDVLLLEGRRLSVFPGRKGALPAAGARWERTLPADVTFVDALAPSGGRGPALVVVGREGTRALGLDAGKEAALPGVDMSLSWTDSVQANFAPLVRAGGLLLPSADGVRWHGPGGAGRSLALEPYLEVVPAGGFVEDTTVVTAALPEIWVAPGSNPPALWALGGTALRGSVGDDVLAYDVAFLPREGNRELVDLTGDGRPDVVHRQGTNQERTYAFFRTPPRAGDLRPPAALLRLSGYCLDPEFTDLDGDGRLDFVQTAIPIDAANTMRALGGKVTANTKAFLNRGTKERLFAATPDASVASDVGVAIRFTAGGTIEIKRSFTILVDGDHDGDGRKDLAIRTGEAELTIRAGVEGGGVWAAEGRTVAIPPVGDSPGVEGHVADLTGDGRDEIVLVYRKPPNGRDRVWVLRP